MEDYQDSVARFDWSDVDKMILDLAYKIKKADFAPEAIVAISRGGCIPAVYLSHLLSVREMWTVNVRTTLNDNVRAPRQIPKVIDDKSLYKIAEKRILLVDDVTNSGQTMDVALKTVQRFQPAAIRTAVLVWDTVPESKRERVCKFRIDFFSKRVPSWAFFPWEREANIIQEQQCLTTASAFRAPAESFGKVETEFKAQGRDMLK